MTSINNKQQLDYDLPNFTSTKYNSTNWKICHGTSYFLFSLGYLSSSVIRFTQGKELNDGIVKIADISNVIGSVIYFISSSIEWFHYKRGCIGQANLNSNIKTNIDKSCKAAFHRCEVGMKYFLSLLSSLIMLSASIIVSVIRNNKIVKEFSNEKNTIVNIGELITYSIGTTEDLINKAKINANYNSVEAVYETEFTSTVAINILTNDVLREFTLKDIKDFYVDTTNLEFEATDVKYKSVKFRYDEILGTHGL